MKFKVRKTGKEKMLSFQNASKMSYLELDFYIFLLPVHGGTRSSNSFVLDTTPHPSPE